MSKIIKVISSENQKQIKSGNFKICPVCFDKVIPVGVKVCKSCKPKGKPQQPKNPGEKKIPVSIKKHGVWKVIKKSVIDKKAQNIVVKDKVGKVIKCKGEFAKVQKHEIGVCFNPAFVEIDGEWKQIKDINVWPDKFSGNKSIQSKEISKCKPGCKVEFEGKVHYIWKKSQNKFDFVIDEISGFHVVE